MSAGFTRRAMAALLALPASLLAPRKASARDRLLSVLGDRRAAAAVGYMALAAWPRMWDTKEMADKIVRDEAKGSQVLRERLAAAIRDDFAMGRTLKLDGWLVAETEARLCVLAALEG